MPAEDIEEVFKHCEANYPKHNPAIADKIIIDRKTGLANVKFKFSKSETDGPVEPLPGYFGFIFMDDQRSEYNYGKKNT